MQAAAVEPLETFAVTKVQTPRLRPGLITRPHLAQRMAHAIAHSRLVLLSAPAGFGKTTALAQAVEQLPPGSAAAWVSVDRGDDLAQLLACLFAALAPVAPTLPSAHSTLLAGQQRQAAHRPALVWAVLNALDAAPVAAASS